jgi:hypothetical protein
MSYFKGYVSDARAIVTSPLAWRSTDWLKFSLIAGVALTVAQEEDDIQHWMQDNRSDDSNIVAGITEPLGNGKYAVPALGALYCYGRLFGDDRARRAGLLSIESVVISGAVTAAVKYLSHKHRPGAIQADEIPWEGPGLSTANLSFPSGHSACAFAIGTVVASEYGDNAFVPPLAYGAAALCAWSRLHDNAHWVSDIIIGSAIGHFTGRAVVGLHGGGGEGDFSLVPAVNETGAGLSLSYKF